MRTQIKLRHLADTPENATTMKLAQNRGRILFRELSQVRGLKHSSVRELITF